MPIKVIHVKLLNDTIAAAAATAASSSVTDPPTLMSELLYKVFTSHNCVWYLLILIIPSLIFRLCVYDIFFYVEDDESEYEPEPRDYKEIYDSVKENPDFNSTAEETKDISPPTEELENLWKSRILMTYDEKRGTNIIMNYDIYREAFTYYCDLNYIPYEVLNEIARRYVVTYRCTSFFVPDESLVEPDAAPDDTPPAKFIPSASAPLTKSYNVNTISNRFGSPTSQPQRTAAAATAAQKEPEKKINKYIRGGKLCDFNFLKKPPRKAVEKKQNITYSSFRNLFA
jgi:hypothetical protein